MNMLSALLQKAQVIILSMSQVWYPTVGEHVNPETPQDTYDRRMVIADTAMLSSLHGNLQGFKEESLQNFLNEVGATPITKDQQISKFHPMDALALILTIERAESGLDYFVHAGETSHLGTQDSGKARCLGQVQTWKGNTLLSEEEHEALSGTDVAATLRCADAIHTYLWYHAVRCKVRTSGKYYSKWTNRHRLTGYEANELFSYYAKGTCTPKFTKKEKLALRQRMALYKEIRDALEREEVPDLPARPLPVDEERVASNL